MLGRRRGSGAHELALQPDRVPEVHPLAEALGQERRCASAISASVEPNAFHWTSFAAWNSSKRLDSAGQRALSAVGRRLVRQHQGHGVRVLIRARVPRPSSASTSPARRRAANLPLVCVRPRSPRWARTSSSTSSSSSSANRCRWTVFHVDPEPEAEGVAVGLDPLGAPARAGRSSSGTRRPRAARGNRYTTVANA